MTDPTRWLSAEGLDAILADLARDDALIAPVGVDGDVIFDRVRDPRRIVRDYLNTLAPPKDWLLPPAECLLRYTIANGEPALAPEPPPAAHPARVLFGVRSCDVAALGYLDTFLSAAPFRRADLADDGYAARRAALTLISVVCQEPGETCMCVCCEGGPALEGGYDWQLTALDDGWLVEIAGDRGRALAERFAHRLAPATEAARAEMRRRVRAVVEGFAAFSTRRVPTMAASRVLSRGDRAPEVWDDVADRCIECGGCAFVCPTCFCFSVSERHADCPAGDDASRDGEWTRERGRDCCILPSFVRQAGGAYPRHTTGERCQTRFFHKLAWQFHDRLGRLGCTGCGRCVVVCPSGLGIDRVAERLTATLAGGARRGVAETQP